MSSGEVEQELARIRGEIDRFVGIEESRKRAIESALGKLAVFSLDNENLMATQSDLLQEMEAAAMWNETVETEVMETERAIDNVLFGSPTQEAMTMRGMWEEFRHARHNAFTFSHQALNLANELFRVTHAIRADDPVMARAHFEGKKGGIDQLLQAALEATNEATNYGQGSGGAGDQYRPRL